MGRNTEKRSRGGALEIASAADSEEEKEHAQLRNPELKTEVEAHRPSVAEGVGGVVSAWVSGECNRALGREISLVEEEQHAELAQAAKLR